MKYASADRIFQTPKNELASFVLADGQLYVCGRHIRKSDKCDCGQRDIEQIVFFVGVEFLPVCTPCAQEMRGLMKCISAVVPFERVYAKAKIRNTDITGACYAKRQAEWQALLDWIRLQARFVTVDEIMAVFDKQRTVVCNHLRQWLEDGLLERERKGSVFLHRWIGE